MADSANKKSVLVAVGVIVRNGQILLAKRADHQHQGGLWEFPGGKVEADEQVEQALARELFEELKIQVTACDRLLEIKHDYPDKSVCLDIWAVTEFTGEPVGAEGQPLAWVAQNSLRDYPLPAANAAIVEYLERNPV